MKIAVRTTPSTSQKRTAEPSWSLIRLVSADRDDEEEPDREDQRERDGQPPGEAADRLGSSSSSICAFAENASARKPIFSDSARATTPRTHRQPQHPVPLRPGDDRLGGDLDLALGRADGGGPGRDAAHHHALEDRLTADRRVAGGDRLAVGHRVALGPPSVEARSLRIDGGSAAADEDGWLPLTPWPPGGGSALLGRRCRPASACRCRTGGMRSRSRRGSQAWWSGCRTRCRTRSARAKGCIRGVSRSSSPPSLEIV